MIESKVSNDLRYRRRAAQAAHLTIKFGLKKDGHVPNGDRLLEIMYIYLVELRKLIDREKAIKTSSYISWLLRVEGVINIYTDNLNAPASISTKFFNVLFWLHEAYNKKDSIQYDCGKSQFYLERSAQAGHPTAAYIRAIDAIGNKDEPKFSKLIKMAIDANHQFAVFAKDIWDIKSEFSFFSEWIELVTNLFEKVEAIKKQKHSISPDKRKRAVHYTDEAALKSMLNLKAEDTKNHLRLYSISGVNDPNEGKLLTGQKLVGKKKNPLNNIIKTDLHGGMKALWRGRTIQIFIGSFSVEAHESNDVSGDRLDLWRFYGRDGKGISISMPLSDFDDSSALNVMNGAWFKVPTLAPLTNLYKVLYQKNEVDDTLKKLSTPIKKIITKGQRIDEKSREAIYNIAHMVISELLYLYKEVHFKNEEEVRIVQAKHLGDEKIKHHQNEGVTFSKVYVEWSGNLFRSPGSVITIGPKIERAGVVEDDIRHCLSCLGFGHCEVRKSKISYQ
jgi:hypothetical protein